MYGLNVVMCLFYMPGKGIHPFLKPFEVLAKIAEVFLYEIYLLPGGGVLQHCAGRVENGPECSW